MDLFDKNNIWNNPNSLQSATTRKQIETLIVSEVFSNKTDNRITYGPNVNASEIDTSESAARDFNMTNEIELKKVNHGKMKGIEIRAQISSLTHTLYYSGQVLEDRGLLTKTAKICRN